MAHPHFLQQEVSRKPRACIPCHERKVRCNASLAGLPCGRCIENGRTSHCQLVPRPVRSAGRLNKDRSVSYAQTRHRSLQALPGCHAFPERVMFHGHDSGEKSTESTGHTPVGPVAPIVDSEVVDADTRTVSEEESQLEICRSMAGWGTNHTEPTRVDNQSARREILEYHDGVNSTTILGELFGQRKTQRFVRVALRNPVHTEQGQTEEDEHTNMDFLRRRGAFNLPEQETCEELLRLYFERVHPYTPVLDRVSFLRGFISGRYSMFLLQCVLTSVMPFVPNNLLSRLGLTNRSNGQRFFFSKAQLLYDLEVEKSQLSLLQGSMVLTASHFAFVVDKDCRFWLMNAARLATQMGLHRKQIADHLDQRTRKLFARIFWALYKQDVLMAIAGRVNVRHLNDSHCDVPELTENDWDNEGDLGPLERLISPVPLLQKLYFVQNTKLSQICARFIQTFRHPDPTRAKAACAELEKAVYLWRRDLPAALHVEMVEHWSSDAVWILVLRAMSYRLECVLYRSMRNLYDEGEYRSKQRILQKQQTAMFELSTVFDRVMLQDLVACCPLSMTTAASTVVAMHIETALQTPSPSAKRQASQTQIHKGLAYLRTSSEHWESARGPLRMLEEIADKTGLTLDGLDRQKFDFSSMSPFAPKPNEIVRGRTENGGSSMAGADGAAHEDHLYPKRPGNTWTRYCAPTGTQIPSKDPTYETILLDDDPERWLNDMLAENVLGLDSTQPWVDFAGAS